MINSVEGQILLSLCPYYCWLCLWFININITDDIIRFLEGFVPWVSVKHIVLEQEYGVEKDRHDWKNEFHQVERISAKYWFSKGHSVDPNLDETERTTCQVQNHVGQWPANSGLTRVVQINLWHIFNERDSGFTVAHYQERVPVQVIYRVVCDLKYVGSKWTKIQEDQKCNDVFINMFLDAAVIHENLDQLHRWEGKSV